MKIGVLGSGSVAQTLAAGFVTHGHDVAVGTRNPAKLADWQKANAAARVCSFADAAASAEVIVLAVNVADDLGRTPLMIAAESFRNETIKVRMLLAAGADVTMRDDQGRTAAERVANSSNAELRSLLNAQ